jgi:hypothetical protein
VALQLMMLASQIPPQINPPAETVAIFVLLLLKVMSAAIAVPAEFCAIADSVTTPPSFTEIVEGVRMSSVTMLLAAVPLPPHPGRHSKIIAATAAKTGTAGNRCMYPPRWYQKASGRAVRIISKGKP